ncbi:MAG: Rsd/AlgQ family anti-sigma factor [Halioglobus sp.]|nr:Rsd/AlgQ family anti-sigma factor [Halioglobus sp.]|tara:strand:- start:1371 stop:1856 length:486 start_codon:yes stop_codon:yes gene_type:complete
MGAKKSNPKQQFAVVEQLLLRWLKERREVLARYAEMVVAVQGGLAEADLGQRQAALCELLVDYVSAGHFEVYHELIEEAESFGDGNGLAQRLMPAIGDTTEVILAYEEKYGSDAGRQKKLKRDLSALGEVLESRFTLEDQLIADLHGRHRREVEDPAPDTA